MSLELRGVFGHFASGVAIITAEPSPGRTLGMTVNSFSSLSLDPPLLLWSIARSSANFSAFCEVEQFAVQVLRASQRARAERFARRDIDRCAEVGFVPGDTRVPVLAEYHACFECVRHALHDGGDHAILVGRVLRFRAGGGEPLLFYRGRFARLDPPS
jgi:flavin reductase (DIM6/NTAB) family NADH-FMN oxidoreductase RutF